MIIGLVVLIAIVAYFVLHYNNKNEVINEPTLKADLEAVTAVVAESKPKAEPAPKKTASAKKAKKVDLDSMNKTELLAYAKANGFKANASLKKDEILERIKNG